MSMSIGVSVNTLRGLGIDTKTVESIIKNKFDNNEELEFKYRYIDWDYGESHMFHTFINTDDGNIQCGGFDITNNRDLCKLLRKITKFSDPTHEISDCQLIEDFFNSVRMIEDMDEECCRLQKEAECEALVYISEDMLAYMEDEYEKACEKKCMIAYTEEEFEKDLYRIRMEQN